ncbi:MAG: hypothetical protein U1E45_15065 [Geminicoccaceae bacterium]
MASWPATLPALPRLAGWSESEPDVLLRTEMEVGPAKSRRRSTAGVRPQAATLVLTIEQRDTFIAWFEGTIASGAVSFAWVHPVTKRPAALRITAPPKWDALGTPEQIQLTLQLEVLP